MKLELLKSIITDLHLAGIYDIPANATFDNKEVESAELLKSLFGEEQATQMLESMEDEIDNSALSAEINNLFATLGASTSDNSEGIELIAQKSKFAKKQTNNSTTIIDPRLAKNKATANPEQMKPSVNEVTQAPFVAEQYITVVNNNMGKYALVTDYKNDSELKASSEFSLLENILKAINTSYDDLSIVFVDNSYKKATLENENNLKKLAKLMQENVESIDQGVFVCLGQSCLDLIEQAKVRDYQSKLLDAHSKQFAIGYSLSALANSPKYKAMLWKNLLLTLNK